MSRKPVLSREFFTRTPDKLEVLVDDGLNGATVPEHSQPKDYIEKWFELYYLAKLTYNATHLPHQPNALRGIAIAPMSAPGTDKPFIGLKGSYIYKGAAGMRRAEADKQPLLLELITHKGKKDFFSCADGYDTDRMTDVIDLGETLSIHIAELMLGYYRTHGAHRQRPQNPGL